MRFDKEDRPQEKKLYGSSDGLYDIHDTLGSKLVSWALIYEYKFTIFYISPKLWLLPAGEIRDNIVSTEKNAWPSQFWTFQDKFACSWFATKYLK